MTCSACRTAKDLPFAFSMAFQPIVRPSTGEVFAYEALVRGPAGGWRTWTGEPVPEADVLIARHRNEPAEAAWHRYSEAQVATVTAIGAALHAAYRFKGVVGHEDIAPRRKVDPGPAFPLKEVAARIMGEG